MNTQDIATNLLAAGAGSGVTALLARAFIANVFKRFEAVIGAVAEIKETLAAIKVHIESFGKMEKTMLDFSQRITVLETKVGICRDK